AFVTSEVPLIAPAEIVRGCAEIPGTVRTFIRVFRIREQHAVPDVLITLKSRRISVDAGGAPPKLELMPGLIEQAVRGLDCWRGRSLGGCGRRGRRRLRLIVRTR